MPYDVFTRPRVEAALSACRFRARGAVITDLDGTAVHQDGGHVLIVAAVQHALERIRESGRPIIVNTLRFPLSIMRTFGRQWAKWSRKPLPCVTLNGSLIGDLVCSGDGELSFAEQVAFPLERREIDDLLSGLQKSLDAGVDRFTVFAYSRSWRQGELVWTPAPDRLPELRTKYVSASEISSGPLRALRDRLADDDVCMISVLLEDPSDHRLAFQHGRAADFVTARGVDKRSGAAWLCARLSADVHASVGAGDTELDTFLDGVGLSLHVGNLDLAFRGMHDTMRLRDPPALGEVLATVASHCEQPLP